MWILQWLPDWLFHALIVVGAFGFLLTYFIRFIPIPAVYLYKTPIQIVSVILMVIGVYMSGAVANENKWKQKVSELESKLAIAEEKSKSATEKIDEKVEKQKQKIVEKQVVVKQYIDREVVKYNDQCVIPQEFIEAHNRAAEK